ncbi:MAG: PTS transporter subunit EIIC [Candidatus Eremiobacteraeota bacterium]|nr:PTS transporter subunit EIIC [Candidatus Eremiobacteraeota bacterium]
MKKADDNEQNKYSSEVANKEDEKNMGFAGWLEKKIFPFLSKLNELKILQSVRDSVFSSIPLIVVGFILLFFLVFNTGTYAERAILSFSSALGLLGIWIAFYLPIAMGKERDGKPAAICAGIFGLTLLAVTFPDPQFTVKWMTGFLQVLSKGGIILAMVMSGLYSGLIGKILKYRPGLNKYLAIFLSFLAMLIPLILLKISHVNIYHWIDIIIAPLMKAGDTLPAAMIIVFLMSLFWLFGVHGSGVVGGAVLPFYLILYNENVMAHLAGLPLPHIVTPSFFIWSMIGGTGATLPLCIYMLFSKSKRLKKIARISILPSLVNINEPLLFGTPIIMNPIIAIPFLLTPVVIAVINYAALYYNLAGRIFIIAPFVIPQPLHAYACTLDVRNVVLLIIDIVVAFLIYYPFFRMFEVEEMKEMRHENG